MQAHPVGQNPAGTADGGQRTAPGAGAWASSRGPSPSSMKRGTNPFRVTVLCRAPALRLCNGQPAAWEVLTPARELQPNERFFRGEPLLAESQKTQVPKKD